MYIGDWQWLAWDNVPGALDWIGFILGGVGILVALVQLFRSRGALKAAKSALDSTRLRLMTNQLVSILPSFETTSKSIDDAIRENDRDAASAALAAYCSQAHRAASLIRSTDIGFTELSARITIYAKNASDARDGLFYDEGTVHALIGHVASDIRILAAEIGGMSLTLQNDAGDFHA